MQIELERGQIWLCEDREVIAVIISTTATIDTVADSSIFTEQLSEAILFSIHTVYRYGNMQYAVDDRLYDRVYTSDGKAVNAITNGDNLHVLLGTIDPHDTWGALGDYISPILFSLNSVVQNNVCNTNL